MGTWGFRIYEDDAALDLRGDFMDKHATGTDVAAIERAVLEEYTEEGDDYYNDVAILALCCAELETGTLTDKTKSKALEVIESGRQVQHWREEEGDAAGAGLRSHELTLIKKYIDKYTGQPVKRKSWVELQQVDKVEKEEEPAVKKSFTDSLLFLVIQLVACASAAAILFRLGRPVLGTIFIGLALLSAIFWKIGRR